MKRVMTFKKDKIARLNWCLEKLKFHDTGIRSEDYEYLYLLEQLLNDLAKSYNLTIDVANYVQHLSNKLFNGTKPTLIDSNITLSKEQLACLILLAKNGIIVQNDGSMLNIYANENVSDLKINGNVVTINGEVVTVSAQKDNTIEFKNNEGKIFKIHYSL